MHSLEVSSSRLNSLIELQESEKLWKSIRQLWCHVGMIAFGPNLVLLLSLRSVIRMAMLSALGHSSNLGGRLLSSIPNFLQVKHVFFLLSFHLKKAGSSLQTSG